MWKIFGTHIDSGSLVESTDRMDVIVKDDDPHHDPQTEHYRLFVAELGAVISSKKRKFLNVWVNVQNLTWMYHNYPHRKQVGPFFLTQNNLKSWGASYPRVNFQLISNQTKYQFFRLKTGVHIMCWRVLYGGNYSVRLKKTFASWRPPPTLDSPHELVSVIYPFLSFRTHDVYYLFSFHDKRWEKFVFLHMRDHRRFSFLTWTFFSTPGNTFSVSCKQWGQNLRIFDHDSAYICHRAKTVCRIFHRQIFVLKIRKKQANSYSIQTLLKERKQGRLSASRPHRLPKPRGGQECPPKRTTALTWSNTGAQGISARLP